LRLAGWVGEVEGVCEASAGQVPDPHGAVVAAGDEQVEDELASRGGGVDRVAQRAERDPALAERGDGVEQVAGRAAEPVELPDDEAQCSGRCQEPQSSVS